jgi:hypothetical protein
VLSFPLQVASEKLYSVKDVPFLAQFDDAASVDRFQFDRGYFPINVAIKKAIEVILHYYAYREV